MKKLEAVGSSKEKSLCKQASNLAAAFGGMWRSEWGGGRWAGWVGGREWHLRSTGMGISQWQRAAPWRERSFKERVKKPRVPGNLKAYLALVNIQTKKTVEKKRNSYTFLTQKGCLTQLNLEVSCRGCIRGWESWEGKTHHFLVNLPSSK